MRRRSAGVVLALLLGWPVCRGDEPKAGASKILLDDFEGEPQGWTYVGGWEFPGAKGELALDAGTAHRGKRSYTLRADFRGGGAYVGTWRDVATLKGRDFREVRLWVKAVNVSRIGVRIEDSSGQIHQANGVRLAVTKDWQELVLKIPDLVGGEHWGGANDGKWHGPVRAFGLNVGKDAMGTDGLRGELSIDDVAVVPGAVVEGKPTIRTAVLNPAVCRPGFGTRITYRWEAAPLGRDFTPFVHFIGPDGRMTFQGDHAPEVPTSIWSGRIESTHTILVPADVADGQYRIVMGLWDPRTGDRPALEAGEGVIDENRPGAEPANSYQVGVLTVDSRASLPKLPAPSLKLDGYTLTFSEEFNDLSVSSRGPGTRWIAHTPGNTDFGDARFADPVGDVPFKIEKGILRIEAAKEDGKWRGAMLASVDPQGRGFAQKFGYFEMRARFPASPGMWPAFWLLGQPSVTDRTRTNVEIDVVEHYGVMPNGIFSSLHLWHPDGKHPAKGDVFIAPGLTEGFHNYGVMVDEADITWYFDGIEIFRRKTPEEAKVPLYLLVDLAMGGGWPIDKAVSPSYMHVDHVRVYARRAAGR